MSLLLRFVALFVFVNGCLAAASTINVPAQQPTIQAGINAAVTGDTVVVAPGTYAENINFNGKGITVKSSKGAATTIIDGGNLGPVVTFASNEGPTSILQGFTIQHGSGNNGGGIFVSFASPIITNNRITKNTAGIGGGIFIGGTSTASVLRNTITANTATNFGGGLALYLAGGPTVENNRFSGNIGTLQGGAISMIGETDEIIVQNLMTGDIAPTGIELYSFMAQSKTGFRLVNNTFVTRSGGGQGVVVTDGANANAQLYNNLIISPVDQIALLCNPTYAGGPPVVGFNDAFDKGIVPYSGSCIGFSGTNGNVSVDPKFVNQVAGNYKLSAASPAINAGTNSAPDLLKKDFAFKPRIDGGTIDIGAYEY